MSRVKKVDLYENGTIAIVEAVSPELGNRVQRVRVQLPGTSQELLQKFRERKVDFAAHTQTEDGNAVFFNLIGAYWTSQPAAGRPGLVLLLLLLLNLQLKWLARAATALSAVLSCPALQQLPCTASKHCQHQPWLTKP